LLREAHPLGPGEPRDWNWYLPRWLDWLPRTSHEASTPRRDTPTGALAPATSD
jgi:hypothetical protein